MVQQNLKDSFSIAVMLHLMENNMDKKAPKNHGRRKDVLVEFPGLIFKDY